MFLADECGLSGGWYIFGELAEGESILGGGPIGPLGGGASGGFDFGCVTYGRFSGVPSCDPYAEFGWPAPGCNPYAKCGWPGPGCNPYAGFGWPAPGCNPYAGFGWPAPGCNPYVGLAWFVPSCAPYVELSCPVPACPISGC